MIDENVTSCSPGGLTQVSNILRRLLKLNLGFDSLKLSFSWIPHLNFIWKDLYKRQVLFWVSAPIIFYISTTLLQKRDALREMQYRHPVQSPLTTVDDMQDITLGHLSGSSNHEFSLSGMTSGHSLLGGPLIKLKREKWSQFRGLPPTVSGSPGLQLWDG